MIIETVLTDKQIEDIRRRAVAAFDGTMQPFESAARAIEQAVLQSPEVQQMRLKSARYDWIRADDNPHDVEAWLCTMRPDSLDAAINAAMEKKG